MLKITEEQAKAIRRKRADMRLSKKDACQQMGIGINGRTLSSVERGEVSVRNSTYAKVMEWLAKDY